MLIRVSLWTGTGAHKATPDLCVNVIATVQVPLTGSHSPSSCSLHSFCQDKIWHLYTPVSVGILAPPPSPPPPDTQHLLDIVTLLAFIL